MGVIGLVKSGVFEIGGSVGKRSPSKIAKHCFDLSTHVGMDREGGSVGVRNL